MTYLPRAADEELDELLVEAAAVAIDGPKGVGKTDTARRRAKSAWFLDDLAQRDLVGADPSIIRSATIPVLIDEWQRHPATWDTVRRWVDDGAPPGAVLLTGSATPTAEAGTHSGAGRILSLRMRPMALFERGITHPAISVRSLLAGTADISGRSGFGLMDYLDQIVASGFPAINRAGLRVQRAQLDGYLQRVVDRDLPDLGLQVRRPETLRRWLTAYAAATSSATAYSRILDATTAGDGTQPAKTTTITYRDHLTRLWLLDPVPGWSPSRSRLTRLQQGPKHHLADPALAARLLNLTRDSLLTGSGAAMTGPLFESLATLSVRVAAQVAEAKVGHLRTHNGNHEVDLVVEGRDGQILGIEVKLARDVGDRDVAHLHWLGRQVGDDLADLVVLTTGDRAYRRRDGVAVIPLALLGV